MYSDPMAEMALFFSMFALIWVITLFFAFAIVAFQIVCKALTFHKAGEPWWKAIIPFYAEYTVGKLAKAPTSWFWGFVIAWAAFFVVLFIGYIIMFVGIAAESVGLILFGFTLIMLSLIAIVVEYIFWGRMLWRFSQTFGFEGAFGLGLLFLPYIFWAILAFGKSEYKYKDGEAAQAFPQPAGQQEQSAYTQMPYQAPQTSTQNQEQQSPPTTQPPQNS
jgi:hypothetical protein